jgi:hypothetical protein
MVGRTRSRWRAPGQIGEHVDLAGRRLAHRNRDAERTQVHDAAGPARPGLSAGRSDRRADRAGRPAPVQTLRAKGYDYNLRRRLRGRGIVLRIARKGIGSSDRLGRHHWTVD